jgi:hypothetical protein
MVEVGGLFVNPPKKHCAGVPNPLGGDVTFVVAFKV